MVNKKHKLISVKLLRKLFDEGEDNTLAVIHFSVKGVLDGQRMMFTGFMTITDDRQSIISFDDESMASLDDWFDECGEKLHNKIFVQLAKNVGKYR